MSFKKPVPGSQFPLTSLPRVGGGEVSLRPDEGRWKVIVVYRGIFCPLCAVYLPKLEAALEEYHKLNVDLVAISGKHAVLLLLPKL
jgi:peroxiredoxin